MKQQLPGALLVRGPLRKQADIDARLACLVLDILTCLEELCFTVSDKELTEPEKNVQTVRRLFEYLLEVLTGKVAACR